MPMIYLAQITVLEKKTSVPHRCYKTGYQCTVCWLGILYFYITFIFMAVLTSQRPVQTRDDNKILGPPPPRPLSCRTSLASTPLPAYPQLLLCLAFTLLRSDPSPRRRPSVCYRRTLPPIASPLHSVPWSCFTPHRYLAPHLVVG